jgi:nitrogen-specific signal transduction histidine kinase
LKGGKGTGLGLSVTQKIITEHGGASRWTRGKVKAVPFAFSCPETAPSHLSRKPRGHPSVEAYPARS